VIVLDTSVVVDLLLDLPPHADAIRDRVRREAPALAAPHLLDVEVAQVLRRYVRAGDIRLESARSALRALRMLPIVRYPHTPLLERALELRDNVTAYDAMFLALAEGLAAPLLTRDGALGAIPGAWAVVEVLG